ncbi:MAG: N-acetyl-gamma-glutamyl-phosphate reductase [Bacteroidota bacterium]
MEKIKVGIVGAAGYTGGELIRLLINHPFAEIGFAHSKSQAGKPVSAVHRDLFGDTDLVFANQIDVSADVVFLCMGHGESSRFLEDFSFPSTVKLIDLGNDFRLNAEGNDFVYGLPELNRGLITKAQKIANPGCFATAIQLALFPLAEAAKLNTDINITAVTGSTGAGQGLSATSHFSWRTNNLSVYKAFSHQHEGEIKQSLAQLQGQFNVPFHFVPVRGDFSRGIMASVHLTCDWTAAEAEEKFRTYYANHPFVHISSENIDLKQVVNTNKCLVNIEKHGDQLHIISMLDNLLKGASGQAVQNMNLMFGFAEMAGLRLKAAAY